MDFGRLPSVEHVKFMLPPDPPENKILLQKIPRQEWKVEVGAPSWTHKEWIGKIYPPKTKEKDFLFNYSRIFDAIELNATRYNIPDEKTVTKWNEVTPENFLFCPKIPQTVSHVRNIHEASEEMLFFFERMSLLKNKLGTFFLQLPPHFHSRRQQELIGLLESVPEKIKLSVELRHESWFEKNVTEELFRYLEKKKIGVVVTDVAGRRDVLHMRLTNQEAFVRFAGNNLHPTDFSRLDDWAARVLKWKEEGLHRLYFFVHTANKEFCPELAAYFCEKINHPFNAQGTNPQGSLF